MRRTQRDDRVRVVHALDDDGGVRCNSRDVEAAHRADVGDLRVGAGLAVTCRRCLAMAAR